jgi:predicted acylesterase/phospholipase RssA
MEFLIARWVEIENRQDITNHQGQIVGADVKFKFLEDRDLIVGGENQGTTNQTVFESASFDALARKATRPFLIINATNLYQGARFEFTDPQFRYLGSDISSYPVSRAVAASSAFPFLLSPISLVNYAKPPGYEISEKDQDALEDYWINKRTYYTVYNNYLYAEPAGPDDRRL